MNRINPGKFAKEILRYRPMGRRSVGHPMNRWRGMPNSRRDLKTLHLKNKKKKKKKRLFSLG
jgi:hypothetical protein